jgi:hypothetical protein
MRIATPLLVVMAGWTGVVMAAGCGPASTVHTWSRVAGRTYLSGSIPRSERVGQRVHLRIHFQSTGEWWPYNALLSLRGLDAWQVLNNRPYEGPQLSPHHPFQPVLAGDCRSPGDEVPGLIYEEGSHAPFITIPYDNCSLDLILRARRSGVHRLLISLYLRNVAESDGHTLDLDKLLYLRPQDEQGPIDGTHLMFRVSLRRA